MKKFIRSMLILAVAMLILTCSARADVLAERWEDAYQKELKNSVMMLEMGYEIPRDQLYELGRTYLLRQYHSGIGKMLKDGRITKDEFIVMKTVYSILIHNNPPGGPDLDKIPGVPDSECKSTSGKITPWKPGPDGIGQQQVEKYLTDNMAKLRIDDYVVTFLVRSPPAWNAFAKRIAHRSPGIGWQEEVNKLAKTANSSLSDGGSAMTGGNATLFATQIPPSIRVNLIMNLATEAQPTGQTMVDGMTAFKTYGEVYGLYGWKGIATNFIKNKTSGSKVKTLSKETSSNTDKSTAKDSSGDPVDMDSEVQSGTEPTLADFHEFLNKNHILLREINLSTDSASMPLKSVDEKMLDELFTKDSIFVVEY